MSIPQATKYDDVLKDVMIIKLTYTPTKRHSKVSTEVLADQFSVGLERARETLKAKREKGTISANFPLSRRINL